KCSTRRGWSNLFSIIPKSRCQGSGGTHRCRYKTLGHATIGRTLCGGPTFLGFSGSQSGRWPTRSEEHTSELQSRFDIVCRLLLEKKKMEVTKSRLKEID